MVELRFVNFFLSLSLSANVVEMVLVLGFLFCFEIYMYVYLCRQLLQSGVDPETEERGSWWRRCCGKEVLRVTFLGGETFFCFLLKEKSVPVVDDTDTTILRTSHIYIFPFGVA